MHHHKKFLFIFQHTSFFLSYSSYIICHFSTFWSQTAKINIMIILQLSIQGNITKFNESMQQLNPVQAYGKLADFRKHWTWPDILFYHIHTILGQKWLFPKIGPSQILNVANFQVKCFWKTYLGLLMSCLGPKKQEAKQGQNLQ